MECRIIKSPSRGAMEMLERRRSTNLSAEQSPRYDAVGLMQGKLLDMVAAADVAEKAAAVCVEEIRGICPQHITMMAIFGDTASVEAAICAVKKMEPLESGVRDAGR